MALNSETNFGGEMIGQARGREMKDQEKVESATLADNVEELRKSTEQDDAAAQYAIGLRYYEGRR